MCSIFDLNPSIYLTVRDVCDYDTVTELTLKVLLRLYMHFTSAIKGYTPHFDHFLSHMDMNVKFKTLIIDMI